MGLRTGTPVGEVGGLRYFVFRRGEKLPAITSLDVTLRVPGSEAAMSDERRQAIKAMVTGGATRYKAAIESWPG